MQHVDEMGGTAGESRSRFELIREIGRGGSGIVYLARQHPLAREVALKLLDPARTDDPAVYREFLEEAARIARLRHRNIIKIHDVGQIGGMPFICMELHAGGSVAERPIPLPPAEALRCVRDVASALATAHAAGILHGDIKPGNVLCHEDGGYLLSDFGVAAITPGVDPERLQRTIAGTPGFICPERLRGAPLNRAGDIFGLGALLYYLLMGRVVGEVPTGDPLTLDVKPLDEVPMLPAALSPLQGTLAALLNPDPANRVPTAEAAAAQLDSILSDGRFANQDPASPQTNPSSRQRTSRVLREWPHVGLDALFEPRRPKVRGRRAVAGAGIALVAIAVAASITIAPDRSTTPNPDRPPVVVVLPFRQTQASQAIDVTGIALADGVRENLRRTHEIRVLGRSSSLEITASTDASITRSLHAGASHVLSATFERSEGLMAVQVKLRSLKDHRDILDTRIASTPAEVGELTQRIAVDAAEALTGRPRHLRGREAAQHLPDGPHYLRFLEARALVERSDTEGRKRALAALNDIVLVTPDFQPAYVQIAAAAARLAETEPDPEAALTLRRLAVQSAQRAAALDPESVEAMAERGLVRLLIERNWELARQDLERALQASPVDPEVLRRFGLLMMASGDLDRALEVTSLALALDPLDVRTIVNAARLMLCVGGQDDEATELLERAVALAPNAHSARFNLGLSHLMSGDLDLARETFRHISEGNYLHDAGLAIEARTRGDRREAERHISRLLGPPRRRPYALAMAAIAGADVDEAFTLLAEAVAVEEDWIAAIQGEPLVRHLRADPRLRALVERLGFPFHSPIPTGTLPTVQGAGRPPFRVHEASTVVEPT